MCHRAHPSLEKGLIHLEELWTPYVFAIEPWSKVFHFGNPIILAYGKAYAILTFSNVLLTFLL